MSLILKRSSGYGYCKAKGLGSFRAGSQLIHCLPLNLMNSEVPSTLSSIRPMLSTQAISTGTPYSIERQQVQCQSFTEGHFTISLFLIPAVVTIYCGSVLSLFMVHAVDACCCLVLRFTLDIGHHTELQYSSVGLMIDRD